MRYESTSGLDLSVRFTDSTARCPDSRSPLERATPQPHVDAPGRERAGAAPSGGEGGQTTI